MTNRAALFARLVRLRTAESAKSARKVAQARDAAYRISSQIDAMETMLCQSADPQPAAPGRFLFTHRLSAAVCDNLHVARQELSVRNAQFDDACADLRVAEKKEQIARERLDEERLHQNTET